MPPVDTDRKFRLIRSPEKGGAGPSAVAIGNFDGLHRGHQAVLEAMFLAARVAGAVPSVLTFEPHPRRVFAPESPQFRIEPLAVKLRGLRAAGVQQVFMPRFTKAFAAMSAVQFLDEVLGKQLNARAVVTGENFAFGQGRSGTVQTLRDWGVRHGVAVHTVPPVMLASEPCSSSAVREALARGDVAHAGALLGHAYALGGRVIHGDKLGRGLGYPTANIALSPGLKLPRHGIYAVRTEIHTPFGVKQVDGAASLGVRPTIGGQEHASLEVHLFDFAGDIYGAKMRVAFIDWIRAEEKFDSLNLMTQQIARDCVQARERLQATP